MLHSFMYFWISLKINHNDKDQPLETLYFDAAEEIAKKAQLKKTLKLEVA